MGTVMRTGMGTGTGTGTGLGTAMSTMREAKFSVGQVVRHRFYPFRGVVFDIDPEFDNTEEWWLAIPEDIRPHKNQPYYHLLAENSETEYIAYVSEQNLLADETGRPVRHPQVSELFAEDENGVYKALYLQSH
jgi:heat shock protein HspQ